MGVLRCFTNIGNINNSEQYCVVLTNVNMAQTESYRAWDRFWHATPFGLLWRWHAASQKNTWANTNLLWTIWHPPTPEHTAFVTWCACTCSSKQLQCQNICSSDWIFRLTVWRCGAHMHASICPLMTWVMCQAASSEHLLNFEPCVHILYALVVIRNHHDASKGLQGSGTLTLASRDLFVGLTLRLLLCHFFEASVVIWFVKNNIKQFTNGESHQNVIACVRRNFTPCVILSFPFCWSPTASSAWRYLHVCTYINIYVCVQDSHLQSFCVQVFTPHVALSSLRSSLVLCKVWKRWNLEKTNKHHCPYALVSSITACTYYAT